MEGNTDKCTFFGSIKKFPSHNQSSDLQQSSGDKTPSVVFQYEISSVLDAATEILPFFDFFGAFIKICKNDFEGNINKLRRKSAAHPELTTFRQLLQHELDNGLAKTTDSACIVSVWFKRGLQFIVALIEEFLKSSTSTTQDIVIGAYTSTLKKHHNWIVQKSVTMVTKLAPYRYDIVKKLCLGDENLAEQLVCDERDYVAHLKPVTNHLHNLMVDLGLDKEARIV